MTNIVDMTSVTEGDTFSLKDSGIEVNENKFDIESIGDPENPSKFEITDTKTGKVLDSVSFTQYIKILFISFSKHNIQ